MRAAVGNLKGGAGKTTVSVLLSLLLGERGSTVLVDADPDQQSASRWRELAGADWPSSVEVVPWESAHSGGVLDRADHVIIDCGPKRPATMRAALGLVELAVVPVAQTPAEIAELPATVRVVDEVAAHRDLSLGVLLTRVRVGRTSLAVARETIPAPPPQGWGLPLLDATIPDREAIAMSFGNVPPRHGLELLAFRDLLTELEES